MLKVRGLAAGYGSGTVLSDTDLTVGKGELVALIGANGAGKSTLMKTIAGLLPVYRGEILLDGERIEALNPAARVLRGLCLVPEGRQIFGGHSVEENLRLGAWVRGGPIARLLDGVYASFPRLAERKGQAVRLMSGGEQQMVAIGRALMGQPRILLLDEPSGGLAPNFVAEIASIVAALKRQGVTMMIVEQNIRLALSVADRFLILRDGRVSQRHDLRGGVASEDDIVRSIYL